MGVLETLVLDLLVTVLLCSQSLARHNMFPNMSENSHFSMSQTNRSCHSLTKELMIQSQFTHPFLTSSMYKVFRPTQEYTPYANRSTFSKCYFGGRKDKLVRFWILPQKAPLSSIYTMCLQMIWIHIAGMIFTPSCVIWTYSSFFK